MVGRPSLCGSCGECSRCQRAEYARNWYAENKDRIKAYDTAESAFRANRKITCGRYGITPEQFDHMLEEQGGVCAVCHEEETLVRKGSVISLTIDHDHSTGKVRGLLCNNCNRALGLLKDSAKVLRSAAEYLDKF